MSEINQSTEEKLEESVQVPAPAESVQTMEAAALEGPEKKKKKACYHNRTARLMNNVSILMLVLTAIFFGFQIYMMVIAGMQQGFMISILYNAPSLMLFLLLFVGASALFRFFAEVLELMQHNQDQSTSLR